MKKLFTHFLFLLMTLFLVSCWNADINRPAPLPDVSFPSSGLIAYYPLSYHVNDMSGNNYNGTVHNVIWFTNDRFGATNCSYFSKRNNDGYVEIPYSLNIPYSVTVSFWIKTNMTKNNSFESSCHLVSRNIDGLFNDWAVAYGEGKRILFNTGTTSANYTLISQSEVGNDKWHHVCVIRDYNNSVKYIYIDGLLGGQASFSGGVFTNISTPVTIGYPSPFDGAIDDVRIYNRVLSSAEINMLYAENEWY